VRAAGPGDVGALACAVRELLLELGGSPPALEAMRESAAAIVEDDEHAGIVLVAEAGTALVGVLAASSQRAIHVPGEYALIQDLWVDPAWRSRAVGAELLAALFERVRAIGITRVEVGLPREEFVRFAATQSFYTRNGFVANGPRMRRTVR
jgi:GNAT superfamily N-acetyltransferase